jgi:hypothetical protein
MSEKTSEAGNRKPEAGKRNNIAVAREGVIRERLDGPNCSTKA